MAPTDVVKRQDHFEKCMRPLPRQIYFDIQFSDGCVQCASLLGKGPHLCLLTTGTSVLVY